MTEYLLQNDARLAGIAMTSAKDQKPVPDAKRPEEPPVTTEGVTPQEEQLIQQNMKNRRRALEELSKK